MLDKLGTNSLKFVDERLCPCGDVKPPCTAIFRIADSFDETRLFQPVDDPAERDRLQIQHIGELDLPQSRHPRQLEQHFPLGASNPQANSQAVERLTQRVRGLADLERYRFHLLRI